MKYIKTAKNMQAGRLGLILIYLLTWWSVQGQSVADRGVSPVQIDSILKNDEGFGYISTLDSLLRDRNDKENDQQENQKHGKSWFNRGNSFLANLFQNPLIKWVFWGLIAVLAAFVLFRLFDFSTSITKKNKEEDDGEDASQLKSSIWYQSKVKEAELKGAYRLAVRYLFKNLLATLADRGVISYLPEKTNHSYLSDLKNEEVKNWFDRVLNIYEYVWYGRIDLSQEQYERFKKLFTDIKPDRL